MVYFLFNNYKRLKIKLFFIFFYKNLYVVIFISLKHPGF